MVSIDIDVAAVVYSCIFNFSGGGAFHLIADDIITAGRRENLFFIRCERRADRDI